jgi:hypothetical protein
LAKRSSGGGSRLEPGSAKIGQRCLGPQKNFRQSRQIKPCHAAWLKGPSGRLKRGGDTPGGTIIPVVKAVTPTYGFNAPQGACLAFYSQYEFWRRCGA